MRKYEMMLIAKAELGEEVCRAEIARLKEFLVKNAAENISVDTWGIKKFAYPINYKNEGFYAVFTFNSNPDIPSKITNALMVNENIVRHMFVSKDETKAAPAKEVKKEEAKKEVVPAPKAEVAKPEVKKAAPKKDVEKKEKVEEGK